VSFHRCRNRVAFPPAQGPCGLLAGRENTPLLLTDSRLTPPRADASSRFTILPQDFLTTMLRLDSPCPSRLRTTSRLTRPVGHKFPPRQGAAISGGRTRVSSRGPVSCTCVRGFHRAQTVQSHLPGFRRLSDSLALPDAARSQSLLGALPRVGAVLLTSCPGGYGSCVPRSVALALSVSLRRRRRPRVRVELTEFFVPPERRGPEAFELTSRHPVLGRQMAPRQSLGISPPDLTQVCSR